MRRTMTSSSGQVGRRRAAPPALAAIGTAGLLLAFAAGGCAKEYDRAELGEDSPRGREVRRMIEALRDADPAGRSERIDDQLAADLTDRQRQAARAALERIADADAAALQRIDTFGDRVYRAAIALTEGPDEATLTMLLVETDGQLRWAGPS